MRFCFLDDLYLEYDFTGDDICMALYVKLYVCVYRATISFVHYAKLTI